MGSFRLLVLALLLCLAALAAGCGSIAPVSELTAAQRAALTADLDNQRAGDLYGRAVKGSTGCYAATIKALSKTHDQQISAQQWVLTGQEPDDYAATLRAAERAILDAEEACQ